MENLGIPTIRQLLSGRPGEFMVEDMLRWRAYYAVRNELMEEEQLRRRVQARSEELSRNPRFD